MDPHKMQFRITLNYDAIKVSLTQSFLTTELMSNLLEWEFKQAVKFRQCDFLQSHVYESFISIFDRIHNSNLTIKSP